MSDDQGETFPNVVGGGCLGLAVVVIVGGIAIGIAGLGAMLYVAWLLLTV